MVHTGRDELEKDEEYIRVRNDLDPYLTKVGYATGKMSPEYQQFKKNLDAWTIEFKKLARVSVKISAIEQLELTDLSPIQKSTIQVFRYLAYVESLGVSIVDFLVLLLIASGKEFHISREGKPLSVVHARDMKDLRSRSVTLASKLSFLDRHGIKVENRLINRDLRNKIAHLDFDIGNDGKVIVPTTKGTRTFYVDQEIKKFYKYFDIFMWNLNEVFKISDEW